MYLKNSLRLDLLFQQKDFSDLVFTIVNLRLHQVPTPYGQDGDKLFPMISHKEVNKEIMYTLSFWHRQKAKNSWEYF